MLPPVTQQAQTQLDYGRNPRRHPRRVLRLAASVLLLYPFAVVVPLYGGWLLGWSVLGHPPRAFLDNPNFPGADLLHDVAGLALVGAVPAACLSLLLNLAHVAINEPTRGRAGARLALLVLTWLALCALFSWDPGQVFDW